jgi:hypothetical protein
MVIKRMRVRIKIKSNLVVKLKRKTTLMKEKKINTMRTKLKIIIDHKFGLKNNIP